jgi:hypothetical protein
LGYSVDLAVAGSDPLHIVPGGSTFRGSEAIDFTPPIDGVAIIRIDTSNTGSGCDNYGVVVLGG